MLNILHKWSEIDIMIIYFHKKLSLEQENTKNNPQEAVFILFMNSGYASCSGTTSVVRVKNVNLFLTFLFKLTVWLGM